MTKRRKNTTSNYYSDQTFFAIRYKGSEYQPETHYLYPVWCYRIPTENLKFIKENLLSFHLSKYDDKTIQTILKDLGAVPNSKYDPQTKKTYPSKLIYNGDDGNILSAELNNTVGKDSLEEVISAHIERQPKDNHRKPKIDLKPENSFLTDVEAKFVFLHNADLVVNTSEPGFKDQYPNLLQCAQDMNAYLAYPELPAVHSVQIFENN